MQSLLEHLPGTGNEGLTYSNLHQKCSFRAWVFSISKFCFSALPTSVLQQVGILGSEEK